MRVFLSGIHNNILLVAFAVQYIVAEVFFSSIRVAERLRRYGNVIDETATEPCITITLPNNKRDSARIQEAKERITALLGAFTEPCPEIRFQFLEENTLARLLTA